jgi:hypothetical protein
MVAGLPAVLLIDLSKKRFGPSSPLGLFLPLSVFGSKRLLAAWHCQNGMGNNHSRCNKICGEPLRPASRGKDGFFPVIDFSDVLIPFFFLTYGNNYLSQPKHKDTKINLFFQPS